MSHLLRLAGKAPSLKDVLGQAPPAVLLVPMRRLAARGEPIDVSSSVQSQLEPVLARVSAGMQIAVAVGSRGIDGLVTVVAATVSELRRAGARPFIVPAMGSHGGATAKGQAELLAGLGITTESTGAPIESSMHTVRLGSCAPDLNIYFDQRAASADAVLPINRVKSHTSFTGKVESGLAKMLAIGLGKQDGARELHRLGPLQLEQRIRAAATYIVGRVPVIGGLALVEDGLGSLRHIEFVRPEGIGSHSEMRLLELAKELSLRLPVSDIDVLIVDEMGKDRSGTGMDTKVIGRMMVRGSAELTSPYIRNLVVLSLTGASHGNATGIGLADFIPERAAHTVDLKATYANSLTAGLQGIQRAQVPITLATDHDAIGGAVLTAAVSDLSAIRIVRIRDTLHLNDVMVSSALLDECRDAGFESLSDDAFDIFDPQGHVRPWPGGRRR